MNQGLKPSQIPALAVEPITAPFRAVLTPPGSKSLTNRALLLAALAEGTSSLSGVLFSDDTRVMLDALRSLGLRFEVDEPQHLVTVEGAAGRLPPAAGELFLGNAGTAYRFLTAACCLGDGEYRLNGVERMRQRPIGQLVEALRHLGADIACVQAEGFPPLIVRAGAGLRGGELVMPPTLSSQYLSALLQVGPYCRDGLDLKFEGPVTSRPYVEMTLGLMERFGVRGVTDAAMSGVRVAPGGYLATDCAIEPDASNASYFLAAAAVIPGSRCTVEGLGFRSLQGDAFFAERVLQPMGASVVYEPEAVTVIAPPAGQALRGIDIDLNGMPDMAQTLAVTALFARGPTAIRNVGNLRVKETDRLEALRVELGKLGAEVEVEGDDLLITPPADAHTTGLLRPATIETYEDHRMAMSFAVAGLRSPGVVIRDPACVNKTFPDFFDYLDLLRPRG